MLDVGQMRAQAMKLQGYIDSLVEKDSPEEKAVSKLLEFADESLKPILQKRLEDIRGSKATGSTDVIDIVNESGYTLAQVVRSGFSKIRGSLLHRAKRAEETGEDTEEDEADV